MMKSIVNENLVSFKVLEQKIFDYVCELGRLITQQVLETMIKNWHKAGTKSFTGEKESERPASKPCMGK